MKNDDIAVKGGLIFFLIFFCWQSLFATVDDTLAFKLDTTLKRAVNDIRYDQRPFTWEPFNERLLSQYKDNEDFNYYQKPDATRSFINKVKQWLIYLLGNSVSQSAIASISKVLYYVFIAILLGALGYAIYMFVQSQKANIWVKDAENIKYKISQESIDEIDFESEIEQMKHSGQLKKALRLIYLYALKMLAEKELIHWKEGKTNHEYLTELKSDNLKERFKQLVYYFEYIWYGHFDIHNSEFERIEWVYLDLKKKLETNSEKE